MTNQQTKEQEKLERELQQLGEALCDEVHRTINKDGAIPYNKCKPFAIIGDAAQDPNKIYWKG